MMSSAITISYYGGNDPAKSSRVLLSSGIIMDERVYDSKKVIILLFGSIAT